MTSPLTGDRELRNEVVSITSLAVTSPLIQGYTFINCRIVGPAVLAVLSEVSIEHCHFEADINSLFWEVDPATRPTVYGAVGIQDVSFSNCTFQAIGFAGPRELRELMDRSLS